MLSDGMRLTGALGPKRVSSFSRPALVVRGHLPLVTLRGVIQPFSTFSGVYVAVQTSQRDHGRAAAGRCWCSVTCGGGRQLCPECDAGE